MTVLNRFGTVGGEIVRVRDADGEQVFEIEMPAKAQRAATRHTR